MDSQTPSRNGPAEQPDGQPEARDFSGQTLGEFYVLRRLGQGGMGQVYLAEQTSLKRKVALKILRDDLAADEKSLKRFEVEGMNVARVTHANIVQVYAIGKEKGLHFMALEYVEGRNLRDYLNKKGPPETLVALSIIRQVAAALHRACELGIIHRDIKPENILLTRKAEVKVADFGLSRCFADNVQPLNITRSGVSMGTPLYMSPEQVQGLPVDHRADIYSLGVTSYHIFAGHPPFRGTSPFDVAVQHVQNDPQPLGQIRPDLPAELVAMIHKMMAKKPDDRYQSAREIVKEIGCLRDAIAGAAGGSTTSTIPNPIITVGPSPPRPADSILTQALPAYRPRKWLGWLVAGTIAAALIIGVVLGLVTRKPAAPLPAGHDPLLAQLDRKQKEEDIVKLVHERGQSKVALDIAEGLNQAIKLGFSYLKDRRLNEAGEFFKGLDDPGMSIQLRNLGRLGQAMTLAFQDKPDESNNMFMVALRIKKDNEKGFNRSIVFSNPAVREMVAEALHHNHRNSPATFPAWLEPMRRVPDVGKRPEAK
ncbi:MAG: serine/threonine protein kinase [Planctomycetes bacterium]|nr:serine/threonine protein kinase [Planctomycetota bacterium]